MKHKHISVYNFRKKTNWQIPTKIGYRRTDRQTHGRMGKHELIGLPLPGVQ